MKFKKFQLIFATLLLFSIASSAQGNGEIVFSKSLIDPSSPNELTEQF